MFITNNHVSFHLWWKENMVSSAYSRKYGHPCDFQKNGKKGKKRQNIWRFEQKCRKFEKNIEKGKPHVCEYCILETARICPGQDNKKSQNIITRIDCKIFCWFCFSHQLLHLLKKVTFGWNLLYFSIKTSSTKLGRLSILNLDLNEKIEKVAIKYDKF